MLSDMQRPTRPPQAHHFTSSLQILSSAAALLVALCARKKQTHTHTLLTHVVVTVGPCVWLVTPNTHLQSHSVRAVILDLEVNITCQV